MWDKTNFELNMINLNIKLQPTRICDSFSYEIFHKYVKETDLISSKKEFFNKTKTF
jgi:hypothetical protein